MYKTVRHGDASLQYTILPQIDQFHVNEVSLTPMNPPESPVKDKHCRTCHPYRIILLFACCGIGIYLFDQMGTPNEILVVETRKEFLESPVTESSEFSNIFPDENFNSETSTLISTVYEEASTNLPTVDDEMNSESSDEFSSIPSSSTEIPISSTTEETSTSYEDTSETTTAISKKIVNVLPNLNIIKMPRVSLKLEANDTVPEMYVNSGMATYKKAKITTSLLHGLSLEGLIFKSPEGTMKPWREKWPFSGNSDIFEAKGIFRRDLFLEILVILMVLSVIMALFTARKRNRNNDGAIEVGVPDESSSNLLDVQCRDPVDKE